jgi:hypothetical protein
VKIPIYDFVSSDRVGFEDVKVSSFVFYCISCFVAISMICDLFVIN